MAFVLRRRLDFLRPYAKAAGYGGPSCRAASDAEVLVYAAAELDERLREEARRLDSFARTNGTTTQPLQAHADDLPTRPGGVDTPARSEPAGPSPNSCDQAIEKLGTGARHALHGGGVRVGMDSLGGAPSQGTDGAAGAELVTAKPADGTADPQCGCTPRGYAFVVSMVWVTLLCASGVAAAAVWELVR
jgi:hypothetical protein